MDATMSLRLLADDYELQEADRIYRPHPEGFPDVRQNCLLIGYPGVGKTLLLKTLCYRLRSDQTLLPLYLRIEPWIASIEGEMAGESSQSRSPRELELSICAQFSLALCVLERIYRYGGADLAAPGVIALGGNEEAILDFDGWIREQCRSLRLVVQHGQRLPKELIGAPQLFALVQTLGQATRESGRRLVLLIDQVDRTSAFHFGALASLLRRSDFSTIIATRPCPCAPRPTPLLEATGGGHDFSVHWLGADVRTEPWRALLKDIVSSANLAEPVTTWVQNHLANLSSLLGPSNRALLAFCLEMQRQVEGPRPERASWAAALRKVLTEQESSAATLLGAVCGQPRSVLDKLRRHAVDARRSAGRGPGPVCLHLRGGDLFGQFEPFLRVAAREGLFLPVPRDHHALDVLTSDYELSPLLAATKEYPTLEGFDDEMVDTDLDANVFSGWIRYNPRVITPKVAAVWLSVKEGRVGTEFRRTLEDQLLGRANLRTAKDSKGPAFASAIRDVIRKESHVSVIDLTGFSIEVYVEFGITIGAKHSAILTIEEANDISRCPEWLTKLQIYPHGTDDEMAVLVAKVLDGLDQGVSRVARWIDDPRNEKIDFQVEPDVVAIIGYGDNFAQFVAAARRTAYGRSVKVHELPVLDADKKPGLLYEGIVLARQASHLTLIFGGSQSHDALLSVIGGVFAAEDQGTRSGKKFRRRLVLINETGRKEAIPKMLSGRPDAEVAKGTAEGVPIMAELASGFGVRP